MIAGLQAVTILKKNCASTDSAIVYGRGPLFFDALKEEMGEQVFDDFIRDYYQQNKWGIASGLDLKSLAENHCNCDLATLFEAWVGEMTG